MYAIVQDGDALQWSEVPTPTPAPGQIRIAVAATAVNRADLVQRAGHYRPPPGASQILGLECAGTVDALGDGVEGFSIGQRVCALLTGGGYAQRVVCPAGQVLAVPEDLDLSAAAALPEALCTAHDALVTQAGMVAGDRVVLHAGASGVGTTAIQLCRALGAVVFVTAGSDEKVARCLELGAQSGANRHTTDWWEHPWLSEGVDIILDPVGGPYLDRDVRVLSRRGRVVVLGLMGGRRAEVDLGRVLMKRLSILGTVLRSRTPAERAEVVAQVRDSVWPLVAAGQLSPVIETVCPIRDAHRAHAQLETNTTVGKIVLTVPD